MSSKKTSAEPDKPADPTTASAINMIRAAGAATIVAGVLLIVFAVLTVTLGGPNADRMGAFLDFVVGLALCGLGAISFRVHPWAPWVTLLIMFLFLAGQLWMAYGGDELSGERISVFMLVVPLIVLIFNTLSIGAARTLGVKT